MTLLSVTASHARPAQYPPLDYTSAETLAATMALRRPVAPKPILDASQYGADAKSVAKRGMWKVGRKPTGQDERKPQANKRHTVMTPDAVALLAMLEKYPHETTRFYGAKLLCGPKTVSHAIYKLRNNGHTVVQVKTRRPTYSLG